MAAIFISYRRADNAAGYSRSLAEALRREFGVDQVFRDIKSIPPGAKFASFIHQTLERCQVMLVLIGTQWLDLANPDGSRRLDDPGDWVRREVAAALARDILVVPVLVCGARIPAAQQLPAEMADLASRNAFNMSDDDWDHDLDQLLAQLRKRLELAAPPVSDAAPAATLAEVLGRVVGRLPRNVGQPERPGILRRMFSGLLGWVRAGLFIGLIVWIVYTQNDEFAAGVDRFLARSVEMVGRFMH